MLGGIFLSSAAECNLSRHQYKEWKSSRTPGRPINNVEVFQISQNILSCQSSAQKFLSNKKVGWFFFFFAQWQKHFWKERDLFNFWEEAKSLTKGCLNQHLHCLLQNKAGKLSGLVLEANHSLHYDIYGLNTERGVKFHPECMKIIVFITLGHPKFYCETMLFCIWFTTGFFLKIPNFIRLSCS